MSDIQIPNLPPASALTGTEQLEIVQAGVSVRATVSQVLDGAHVPAPATSLPRMDGGASVGAELTYARGDHVHPTDTSRLAVSGGTITGDLTVTGSLEAGDLLVDGASQFNDVASFPGGAIITGGVIDDTIIGLSTPSIGNFTNLSASGTVSGAGFDALLALYAPKASPVFTGDPKAPTPLTADNDTSIATTAFVKAQGYAPSSSLGTMSTQNANAVAITGGAINGTTVGATTPSTGSFTNLSASGTVSGTGITNLLTPYALVNSQAFTGTPSLPTGTTAVTQTAGNNSTKLATTAYVDAANTAQNLGTMATQNANAVAITGGAINGTTVGATTPSTGSFTTLVATSINSTPIGATTPSTGAFTTLSATGTATFTGALTASPANASVTLSPTGTGTVTINPATLGNINNMTIGATTAAAGTFTNLTATGTVSGTGFTNLLTPYALVNSQVFTGTPSLPTGTIGVTQAAADSTTKLATTAYVKSQNYITGNQSISLTGDVTGSGTTSIAATVVQLQGRPLAATLPSSGNLMGWNGTTWGPVAAGAAAAGGTNTQIQYNNGGVLGGISQNGSGTVVMTTGSASVSHLNDVTITGTNPMVNLNKTATGGTNRIMGQTASLARWQMAFGDSAAESTGNLGSNFGLLRYDDAGTFIDTAFTLNRQSGKASFVNGISAAGATAFTASVSVAGGLTSGNIAVSSGALGTTLGNSILSLSLGATDTNGDSLRSEIQRTAAGTDWTTAAWQLYRQVDAVRMGYMEFNSGSVKPIAFGKGTTEFGSFDTNGNWLLNRNVTQTFANVSLNLNKTASGQNAIIMGQMGGLGRWVVNLGEATAESGSNAGSDFSVVRYTDAGAVIEACFKITRSTGAATFTQALTSNTHTIIGSAASNTGVIINKAASATYSGIETQTAGSRRWLLMPGDNTAEGGSNTGSDFKINRYSDTAVFLDTPFSILRSTGQATFSQPVNAPGIGFRNRIINGSFLVDQYRVGAVFAAVPSAFVCDRWGFSSVPSASKINSQLIADGSALSATGFTNFMKFTTATAYAVVSGDQFCTYQPIEGVNFSDLGFGTAGARPVTVSFWVNTSVTGTHSGCLRNYAQNRSYPFTYSVATASVWAKYSVTIPGDTTGTWPGQSIAGAAYLIFSLGGTGTIMGTAGAWAAANYTGATGEVGIVQTLGATLSITGVQFEAGSVASSFENRSYADEMRLCQRYFQTTYPSGTAIGTAASDNSALNVYTGPTGSATSYAGVLWFFAARMRGLPIVTLYNPHNATTTGSAWAQNAAASLGAGSSNISDSMVSLILTSQSVTAGDFIKFHAIASAEL